MKVEQAQLVTAHTNRTGSSDPNVGLHIVPGHICMTSTENHLAACMLWKENLSYMFFRGCTWQGVCDLMYKSQGEFAYPESEKLEKQKSLELHCIFKETLSGAAVLWIPLKTDNWKKKKVALVLEKSQKVGVGRDLWRYSSPTPMLKQVHLEQVGHNHIQMSVKHLHRRRLSNLSEQQKNMYFFALHSL